MNKYGLFMPNGAPKSLVNPTQNDTVGDELRLRRDGPSFDEILSGQMPSGQVKLADSAREALKLHGVTLSPLELDELAGAIDRFSEVGRKRGLILSERGAFTVDVGRREVEHVIPRENLSGELVEDIDSFIGL